MPEASGIHWQRVSGRLGDVAYHLTRVRFATAVSAKWQPAINAYRCEEGFAVCVDLAGVDKGSIDVKVEQRQLRIRGHRESPEPKREKHRPVQVLMMEIDSGNFERELTFSADIDGSRATAEQQNGLLWIFLPLNQGA